MDDLERIFDLQDRIWTLDKEVDELRAQVMRHQADPRYDERFAQGEDSMREQLARVVWEYLQKDHLTLADELVAVIRRQT